MAVAIGGCASEQARGVDCDRLVDHYIELAAADPETTRSQYLTECQAMALSREERSCILASANLAELDRCGVRVARETGGLR